MSKHKKKRMPSTTRNHLSLDLLWCRFNLETPSSWVFLSAFVIAAALIWILS